MGFSERSFVWRHLLLQQKNERNFLDCAARKKASELYTSNFKRLINISCCTGFVEQPKQGSSGKSVRQTFWRCKTSLLAHIRAPNISYFYFRHIILIVLIFSLVLTTSFGGEANDQPDGASQSTTSQSAQSAQSAQSSRR